MKLLKDKVAVVTGGTRGIGFSVVQKYLEHGATVILFGSREDSVNKAVDKLKSIDSSYRVEGYFPNLTNYIEVEKTINTVDKKYRKIDILVNNAGVSAHESIYDYKPEDFDKVMALNVNAVFYGIKAVAPIMKAQGGGVIINTSSMVSIYGQPAGVA
ncbi:MAG: SDR family NAD(P)-dependent oxidoreductase, partial [Clostridia bacterium]|nr:SDR family NAD(P)-dependent oxidoreductase [Clostridia bacterium]